MSMKFADGTSTTKYDQETHTVTISRVESLQDMITNRSEEFERKIEKFDHDLDEHISRNAADFEKVSHDMDYCMGSINFTTIIIAILLNSKLFQFLNFFGQWFVFDRTDSYYHYQLNGRSVDIKYNAPCFNRYEFYTYYMNMGYKIPWLSRIRYERRFRKEQKENRNE